MRAELVVQYANGREKLQGAVLALSGDESLQQRLTNAVTRNLLMINPEWDLPDDMSREFREFIDEMHEIAASPTEGSISASVVALSEQQKGLQRSASLHSMSASRVPLIRPRLASRQRLSERLPRFFADASFLPRDV